MVLLTIKQLKESPNFIQDIRWEVTPRVFLDPTSTTDASGKPIDINYGYMLYVDLMEGVPALVIMQLKRVMSKTVGYVNDIPQDLLREAMKCLESECIAGMYPMGEKLEAWLKKELGVS